MDVGLIPLEIVLVKLLTGFMVLWQMRLEGINGKTSPLAVAVEVIPAQTFTVLQITCSFPEV
jgi:hypothetical protein